MDNHIQERSELISRMKLLMGYDSKKTLTENVKSILTEDATNVIDLSTAEPSTNDDSDVYNTETSEIKTPTGWMYAGKNIEITTKITTENISKLLWTYDDGKIGSFTGVPIDVKTKLINPPVVAAYTNSVGDKIVLHAIQKNGKWSMVYYTVSSSGKKSQEYNPRTQQEIDSHLDMNQVWDPECETDVKSINNYGTRTTKKKTGCWVDLPSPDGRIDKNGQRLIGLRQDKYGNKVPYGFDVDNYNEYLTKKSQLSNEYKDCIERNKERLDSKYDTYQNNPTDYLGAGGDFERKQSNKYAGDCMSVHEKSLKKLQEQYYHQDFPYGLPHEDYLDFKEVQKTNEVNKNKELKEFEDKHKCKYVPQTQSPLSIKAGYDIANQKGYYIFSEDCLSNEELKQYEQIKDGYTTMDEFMYKVHQYDPNSIKEISKSSIEKWWDKWAWAGELVGWVLLDILSQGAAGYLGAARQGVIISEIIPKLLRSVSVALPAGLGVREIIKEGEFTEESAMWFLFAILPFTHSPKIPITPTVEDCRGLIKLLKTYPMNSSENITTLFKNMSKEQKQIFRGVSRMSSDELKVLWKKGMGNAIGGLPKAERQAMIKLIKGTGGKILDTEIWAKNLLNGLKKGTIRISADITSIEGISSSLKALNITKPGLSEELNRLFEEKIFSPNDFPALMSAVDELISQNPNLDTKGIITKIKEKITPISTITNMSDVKLNNILQKGIQIPWLHPDGKPLSDEEVANFESL